MKAAVKAALVPTSLILAAVVGVSAASAAPKKPINYDARAKQCQNATKGLYSADGRLSAYGFCLSNINVGQPEAASWTTNRSAAR